ncbi:MAG: hypothetical protein MJ229_05740 [bacterium]|nr:hypothetical protein [bacterium]
MFNFSINNVDSSKCNELKNALMSAKSEEEKENIQKEIEKYQTSVFDDMNERKERAFAKYVEAQANFEDKKNIFNAYQDNIRAKGGKVQNLSDEEIDYNIAKSHLSTTTSWYNTMKNSADMMTSIFDFAN